MEIIPVIDLMDGEVVRAEHGLRQNYKPLATPLCPSSNPIDCASSLLSVFPFPTIYLADLNRLMDNGSNSGMIRKLIDEFPEVTFWVDQGIVPQQAKTNSWVSVIGTESLAESTYQRQIGPTQRNILSLDFSSDGLLGPNSLLTDDRLWPEKVIVMNLTSIGAGQGPDWDRLGYFRKHWPSRQFIAAGGIRNCEDLYRIASMGFVGVLLATALHYKKISSSDIDRFMSGNNKLPASERISRGG